MLATIAHYGDGWEFQIWMGGFTFVVNFAANLLQIFGRNLQAYHKILDRIYKLFLVIQFLKEGTYSSKSSTIAVVCSKVRVHSLRML